MAVPEYQHHKLSRVLVTGIGLITAIGQDRESTWTALLAGSAGLRWLNQHIQLHEPRFAGYPIGETTRSSLELLIKATTEALADAGLDRDNPANRNRIATVIGMSKGDLGPLRQMHSSLLTQGPEAAHFCWSAMPGGGAAHVARVWDFRGPCLAPVAACATGLIAVLRSIDLIQRGECDIAVAGAADSSLDPLILGAFRRMAVLAKPEVGESPSQAVKPLDLERSGFLPGEGAAVLILERLGHAVARGAKVYAEVCGGAMGSDASHITNLDSDPAALTRVLENALRRSGIRSDEVDLVNLHATATRTNDPLECQAIQAVLGRRTSAVLAVANKPQIGHTLGAAGAVELAITSLSLARGVVPPTLNRQNPDPACGLRTSPTSQPGDFRAALKLSLGFGGHLAAVALRNHPG